MRLLALAVAAAGLAAAQIIPEIRKLAQAGDLAGAQARLMEVKGKGIWTPELLVAHSWLGRGAQAQGKTEQAITFAAETRRLALEMLAGRQLDTEKDLPIALGASIEVHGHALASAGRRSEGVAFLKDELKRWHKTSIRTRIQKNLHLLSLEGTRAPKLETGLVLGSAKMKSLDDFLGKPVLLFLWAHWCSDCKGQGPVIEALRKEFPTLAVVAPTQRYGYTANGEDASHEKELPYIAQVQKAHYEWMTPFPMPVSEENFRLYGVSSTPTLVLLDARGVVRMYHPGQMKAGELRQALVSALK